MIIIPARIASVRFPKKVLVDINGLPMVVRVAYKAKEVDDTIIATDSIEVIEVCKKYNIEAILTSQNHTSGTERVNEAANILGLGSDEVVINLQGDEPFMESEVIGALKKRVEDAKKNKEEFFMASCFSVISKEEALSPNCVKVVLDKNNNAIYFSRSLIPFDRDGNFNNYYLHLGIYGFLKVTLNEFCNLSKSNIEEIEKLEQLRAIYNGKKISMVEVKSKSFGIDTPEDLQKALNKNI